MFDLKSVKQVTNLGYYSVTDVLPKFQALADSSSQLNREAFHAGFALFLDSSSAMQPSSSSQDLTELINRLYDAFDSDQNGLVDFIELASGLTLLCQGSRDSKIRSAFQLCDTDGDGSITKPELVRYFTSTFRMLAISQPDVFSEGENVSMDELARATAEKAFDEADVSTSGDLSFAEFREWYLHSAGHEHRIQVITCALIDIPKLTNLVRFSCTKMIQTLVGGGGGQEQLGASSCSFDLASRPSVPREKYHAWFRKVLKSGRTGDPNYTPEEEREIKNLINVFFEFFDDNGTDALDDMYLVACCLSLFCAPGKTVCFELLDTANQGWITYTEFNTYFIAVYDFLMHFFSQGDPRACDMLGTMGSDALATLISEELFYQYVPLGPGGVLHREAFERLVQEVVPAWTPEALLALAHRVYVLTEARCYLSSLDRLMMGNTPAAVPLDLPAFEQMLLLKDDNDDDDANTSMAPHPWLMPELFQIFDANQDGLVDADEWTTGLAALKKDTHAHLNLSQV